MLSGLFGRGPKTSDLATINFVLSSDKDLSKEKGRKVGLIWASCKLAANVVTDKSGFSRERMLCLAYLLCIEHQMKSLTRRFQEILGQSVELHSLSPLGPREGNSYTGSGANSILAVTVKMRQRRAPFITFHPKQLSRFPSGTEGAVLAFLQVFPYFLQENADETDLKYAWDGAKSLLEHWVDVGIPRPGSRTPSLPFLLNWQE